MTVTAKAELMPAIEQAWLALNRELNLLSAAQMEQQKDAMGWSVKDALAHLTAWERSVLFFLQGRDRHAGLGVPEMVYLSEDEDQINAAIYAQHLDQPLADVLQQFRNTHAALMALIEPLTDDDLHKPYSHYLPNEPGDGDGPPAINVIYGNTVHHFQEHMRWIASLVVTE
ncbi:MAG: ClbS/DfsB family four-helix bundle protein [Caldilineaceae bacterium]|nr:ClbS/DfsB family four-helix bundle protein [Caldilineaceae bacterium]